MHEVFIKGNETVIYGRATASLVNKSQNLKGIKVTSSMGKAYIYSQFLSATRYLKLRSVGSIFGLF